MIEVEKSDDDEKRVTFKIDEQKKKELPTFEIWINSKLVGHPEYLDISNTALYYGFLTEMRLRRAALITLSQSLSGKLAAESDEFKEAQKQWHFNYLKMQILRSNALQYYGIVPPNWSTEIIPEKYYCGSLLSTEDFEKFVLGPGSLMKKVEPDGEKKYADDARKESEKARQGIEAIN